MKLSEAVSVSLILEPELHFEAVVKEHQALVFRTLARLIGRADAIEDLAQEVFLRLYRALPSFRGEALVSTYVYRITVNVAQDEWKRLRREDRRHESISDEVSAWEERLQHPSANAEEELLSAEFQQHIEEHLMRLSLIERTILVLYHQEEQSYMQIAEALRMPIGTVRTHLHRARKKLREGLQIKEERHEQLATVR